MSDETQEKTCPCGHGRNHHMVSAKHDYTWGGTFWVLFGVSVKPIRLRWVCRKCNQTIDETKDRKEMDKHSSY